MGKASNEVSEFAVTVRDFLSGTPRTPDGQLTPQQERNVILWRGVFLFRSRANMFRVFAHLPQKVPPDAGRELRDDAKLILAMCNGVWWQRFIDRVNSSPGDAPLAGVIASEKGELEAECRRWLEASSALAGPEPEPAAGVVRHRVVSLGPVGSRITLFDGDGREEYEADAPLLQRASALDAEPWVVATTARAPAGDRLLALRTTAEFESWRDSVVKRELDPTRLSPEEYEALAEPTEGGERS